MQARIRNVRKAGQRVSRSQWENPAHRKLFLNQLLTKIGGDLNTFYSLSQKDLIGLEGVLAGRFSIPFPSPPSPSLP